MNPLTNKLKLWINWIQGFKSKI